MSKPFEEFIAEGYQVVYPNCPTCGAPAVDMDIHYEYQNIYPMEEMWEGGPLYTNTSLLPERRILTSMTIDLGCGHQWPSGQEFSYYLTKPGEVEG